MDKLKNAIREFENQNRAKIVYVSLFGSKLFGTNSASSDSDYKGIFIPSKRDVLLKRDIEHFSYNTNKDNKNSSEDIDLELYSIYKWFNLLIKGETGAIDLLFSLFREDTQLYRDRDFVELIKRNYTCFYNRNLHSFVGYCVGQSKKYNIKGKRYNELIDFLDEMRRFQELKEQKLESIYKDLEPIFASKKYKYIKFIKASISRGNQAYKERIFIEVLGKKFPPSMSVDYFLKLINDMQKQFGNRVKNSKDGIDFKALSHAVRVINEIEELLEENFITFPLKNRDYIKSIKYGKKSLESVMNYIDIKLDEVEQKLSSSNLPQRSDEEFIDSLILEFLDRYGK